MPDDFVFDDDDEDLEVEIGDLVTYAPADVPNQLIHARITARQTDAGQGLVAENTPLGTILLGATVGETVVLRVPGKSTQSFVIQGIKRAAQSATQETHHDGEPPPSVQDRSAAQRSVRGQQTGSQGPSRAVEGPEAPHDAVGADLAKEG